MKIYEIGTGYTPIPAQISAATEIVAENLARAFVRQGQEVHILDITAPGRGETDLLIEEVPIAPVFSGTDISLGFLHKLKRVAYSISLAGTLRNILRSADKQVLLHFHNQYNLFFFLMLTPKPLRRKCRIAYTNHSGIWRLDWNAVQDTIRKRYFQEAACMQQADHVFLLNEASRHNITAHLGVKADRTTVIPNGVDPVLYHPLTEEETHLAKEKWGLSGCRVILQVGSVCENKGQIRALEALAPLLKVHRDLVFAYAGGITEDAYQRALLCRAEELGLSGQVRYLGMLAPGRELNEVYNTALATILPSRYEGFSLALVESLAAGVPVLVARRSPFSLGDGCVEYDAERFSQTAEHFILTPSQQKKLSAAARRNALSHYSWDAIALEYRRVWEAGADTHG